MATLLGKDYENSIAEYFRLFFSDSEITQNVKRLGIHSKRLRDIDILIKISTSIGAVELCVECKDLKRPLNVKDIEATLGLMEDIKVQKGLIISRSGFSAAAINRIENSNRAVDLHLIDFSIMASHESFIGIPFKGGVGSLLIAPFGWYLEPCPVWIPKLAVLKPFDQKHDDFIYVNTWNHDEITSKEELNNIRKTALLESVDKKYIFTEWEEEGLLFRQNKAFSTQNAYLENTYEVTAYKDMPNYILELVLISYDCNTNRNISSLKQLIKTAIPIQISGEIPLGRSLLVPQPLTEEKSP